MHRENDLQSKNFVKIIVALLLTHFSLLFVACLRNFPNVDEVAHLPAGVSFWVFGKFDLYEVNPPLVHLISGLPGRVFGTEFDWSLVESDRGARPEFRVGLDHVESAKTRIVHDYWCGRLLCCFFSVFGCVLLTFWVRKIHCGPSPLLVCAHWCFCPSILAHGPTIVPDVAAVCFGLIVGYCCWEYVNSPSHLNAAWCGAAFGLALLTKLTWITGVVSFPVCCGIVFRLERKLKFHSLGTRVLDLAIFWQIALIVLNAGYLFEDSFIPLRNYEFVSKALGGSGASVNEPGNRFAGTWLAELPVPFPRNYVEGFDFLRFEVERRYWSFLDGEWRFGSWPYYYLMTILYKTPESTLLASVLGVGIFAFGIFRKVVSLKSVSMIVMLAVPSFVCLASVSLQGGFNHHHRYVLMIYPPMFVLAAYIASPVGVKLLRFRLPFLDMKKRSFAVPLAFTLMTLSAISSLRVQPYCTSYFNTLSGGPENGWRLLGFSNIDWGQDILEVDKWLKDNPDKRPLVMDIDYFGMNGNLFDVPTSDPPQLPKNASIDEVRKSVTETQWWIISVKKLYNLPGYDGLEYLQQIEPVEKIAYAYHVYRIDPLPIEQESPEFHKP